MGVLGESATPIGELGELVIDLSSEEPEIGVGDITGMMSSEVSPCELCSTLFLELERSRLLLGGLGGATVPPGFLLFSSAWRRFHGVLYSELSVTWPTGCEIVCPAF